MEISNIMVEKISKLLEEGKRLDGREFFDFRDIKIETGISKNAEGSAKVKIGNTEVIAGVKLDVTEPYTDHENEGTLITTAELLPLSSVKFEPGPPKIDSIELARIVDRGIRESGFIDFEGLCIKKGEKVWGIFLDIYTLNADGNLIDAAALASMIALKTAKMPEFDSKTEKVKYGTLTKEPVPLSDKTPITLTFFKIGNRIILDPNEEEEDSADGRLSIALTKDKNKIFINALQKGKESSFTQEDVGEILDKAEEKFKELEPFIAKEIEKNLKRK